MQLHILGIGGTFMGGIALLAKAAGHTVTGADSAVYPPMSTQLMEQGIQLFERDDPKQLDHAIDQVIIGNVMRRGHPMIEKVLANHIPYTSGPAWLAENILKHRIVLAVAGTHGKTTTTSLLTWMLQHAGLKPGFLIGGVPENFGVSAALGESPYFVIEADEYDTAFFDKRSKFVHYHPDIAILNNLEFDHADIFNDLGAIQQQFHFLLRTIPGNGLIIRHAPDVNLSAVLAEGCWTPVVTFGGAEGTLRAENIQQDGSHFKVIKEGQYLGDMQWHLLGDHNVNNALAAIAVAMHIGVTFKQCAEGLATFKNVKRRLEVKGRANNITIYDDFAHHPTAILTTLRGLRAKIGEVARLIAVLEFGSFTMRSGVHKSQLQNALQPADMIFCKSPVLEWGLEEVIGNLKKPAFTYATVDQLLQHLAPELKSGDHVVIMSNTHFDDIHHRLIERLAKLSF